MIMRIQNSHRKMKNNNKNDMNRMVRRALVCCLLFWCFTGHALAQNDPQYVIMYDGHYLAHVNNGGTWELQDATTFSPNCLWFSSNNYNYYFNDGTSLRYLAAPLERDGALYLSDSYPGTQVLNNNLLDYFFYDWDHGLARGEQHPMDECLTIYNNTHLTQCWEVVWVSYENNQWQMSSDYGYDPTTYAAKFYPVTITEHPQVISTETGGVSDLTDLEMDYPSTESLSVTATNYTYTYTPAYTTYVFNNGTHNYYGGTDNGTSTPGSITSSNNTVSGYAWTITGEGAEYLTLTNANTATPTLAYNTTENTTGHKTATLTLTVTYSDGGTQVRTATVLVKTACQNPTQLATPVVDYEGVTVSWVNTSDRYKLYWKKQSDSEFNYVEVSGANTYTLTGLAPSYEGNPSVYEYKVAAFCNNVEITDPAPTVYSFTTAIDPHAVIYGAVFGGGRMANVTGNTNVVIINCDTLAAVYGGNDIAGVVEGANGSTITLGVNDDNTYAVNYNNSTASVKVNIGDVYGGGNGYYAYNGNTFQSATERTYTVASGASVTALSETGWDQPVWTNTGADRTLTLPDICKSTIVVTNDVVKVDSLFGGAKNAFMGQGTEGKGSNITVNGGTIFAVFGGNNVGGGQGSGPHNVTVNATKTTAASLSPNVASTATTGYGRDFGIRYLFGGGNKVYGSTTNVIINGGQCDTIFAGGNSADVYAANLTVNCQISAGSGNNTFGKVYSSAISSYASAITIDNNYSWDGTGVYNVHTLFGGNNQATMEGIPNVTLSSGSVGTVYGGGNAGDMVAQATDDGNGGTLTINGDNVKYSTHVEMNSANMVVDCIYGGCQVSNVHYSTWVEIEDGHVGTVFGGCNVSGDVGSTRLDLEADQWLNPEHTISNPDYQKVYGATYVVASGGTVYKNLFAGGNGYYHCVDANGYYVSGLNYADPEGHYIGLSAPTHNETHVVVNAGATIKGNVYAGGNLACVGFDNNAINYNSNHASFPRFVGLASVRMSGGTVNGNVFGGGNMANVYGSNEVQVSGGTIDKSLYGGNDRTGKVAQISNRVLPADYNMASDGQTSLLEPKVYTYLSLTGKPTITNVYGGGNGDYEYFSNFTDAQNYTGPKETVVTCDSENQPIQRCTFVDVNIDGGSSGGHIGTVYGGGDGVTVNEFLKVFLNVKDNQIGYSNVETIFGGNNKGDLALVPDIILLKGQVNTVYGGCNQGAMTGGKNVTIGSNTYNNVGSYVRLLKEYDPDGAGSTYPAVSTNAKVVNAVYGGCRMNGVTSNSIVFVEGGNHEGVGIFGGSDISGTIGGTSRVVVDGANAVVGNVFGGGNGDYDYTSTYSGYNKPSSVTSRVDMLAGTATNLFAGGNACGSGATMMQVEGGTVTTGIYGGSNTSGTITNATSVNVVSGTVNKVFGGGKGEDTGVNGNVTVNIGNTTGGPTVNGNVYGGSEKGIVNDASTDLTQVNILNGTLNAYVYGGGQGELGNSTKGKVNGQVEVNIGAYDSGTSTYSGSATFGNNSKVFGCNDAGGSPQDNVTVNIYSTGHNSTNSYPNPVPTDAEELVGATASQFAIQAVYGGGNLADYAPQNGNTSSTKETKVHVYQCDQNTIKDVFGGSNQASAQNTHVIIDGGRIDRTFGGGNGEVGPAPVVGTAKTEINAGLITQVFGGSNTNGNIGTIDLNIVPSAACPELILIYEIFSGSNQAPLYGDMTTNLVGDCYDPANPKEPDGYNYYGGTNLAPVYGNVTMNVYGGYYVNLFGGSRGYVDTNDATNNISADIRRFPTQAEVNAHPDDYPQEMKDYLATHNSAYGTGGNVTLNIYGGKIENAFGGSDVLGDIEGKITVNVLQGGGDQNIDHCPLDLTKVYGGGKETEYDPITAIVGAGRLVPEVNILKGTVNEDVFGGGLGASATVTGNPVVTIGDVASGHESYVATVGDVSTRYGNVYGGGELAQVYGNTKIVIQKANTIIEGTVYGGGKGSTDNVDHGLVKGNTWVEMTNGHVRRSIYGGGELGSVGDFTAHYADGEDPLHVEGEPKACQNGTGLTKVRVSGGMVGLNEARMPDPSDPPLDDDFGYIFCAGKGVSDSITYPLANLLAASDSSYLEISGTAVVTGSIYGGSENGQVIRNTRVKIKGGQIGTGHYKDGSGHHWDGLYSESDWTDAINSIKNGTFTGTDVFHQCDAWPFKPEGQRYVYDHYAIYPDANGNYYYDAGLTQSACGGSHSAGDGHSFYGNVFGGGSGYYPYAPGQWRRSAGRVCGNTLVEIVGGHILNNVYGGNEITDVIGHSKVVMKGGTLGVPRSLDSITARPVNSYLFGAGMGDPRTLFNGWSNVGSAEVIVDSVAVIFGSVFGGGEDGHVIANATTTIQGNTLIGTLGTSSVDGNVFGGGRGFSGNALTAGVVCGNVILNIGGNAKLLGSVFGGGRLAAVGTYLAEEGTSNYGKLQPGDTHGNITINITGGTIGNQHHLSHSNYSIGDVFGGSKGTWKYDVDRNQHLGLAKNTTVNISQASGNTTRIYGSVYGGGEIASVGAFTYADDAQVNSYNPTHPSEPLTVGDVYELAMTDTGIAKINITGGTIGQLNTKGHVFGSCLGKAGMHYSGYSFVDSTYVRLNGGTVYGSIFGGGENGHVLHSTNVEIEDGTVGIRIDTITHLTNSTIYRGNVYGGGRGIDEVTNSSKGSNPSATYSITAGKVSGNTNVTVSGGTIYRNVYGGGSFASVGDPDEEPANGVFTTGLATVTVSGGQIGTDGGRNANNYTPATPTRESRLENGFVFGSGRGVSGAEGSVYDSLAYVNNSIVNIQGTAYVTGSVFGGGENGHVKNHTLVNVNPGGSYISQTVDTGSFNAYPFISEGAEPYPVIGYPLSRDDMVEDLEKPRIIYRGNVYGGGRGIDPYDDHGTLSENAGVVYGNTEVRITGGTIRHDVYGGGSVASVGTLTYDHAHNDSVMVIKTGTGNSHVFISGNAVIGIDSTLSIVKVMSGSTLLHNLAGINNGQVFGGGRGQSGDLFKNLAYVDSTRVEISENAVIYGAVFGGGCNGHVKRDTYVKMTGGTIGHSLSESEKNTSFLHPEPIYFGNVYGGGRGIDHTNLPGTISHTAGQVYGNTKVEISGGRVHNDVYGGGSLANVGVERYDAQGNVVGITSGGYAYVTITGNAIIGSDGKNAGFVYGSGRGMAGSTWSDMAYVDMTYVTIGTENGTDNPQVRASVFGGGSNGHVEDDTHVNIYTGTIGTPLTMEEMVEYEPGGDIRPHIYRGNVYGGGRGVERATSSNNTYVLSNTAGVVFGNTNVTVDGGKIYHNVYGGGSLANVGTVQYNAVTGEVDTITTGGTATVIINGGKIGMEHGVDYTNPAGDNTIHSGLNNGQVFGSGRGEAGEQYADHAYVKFTNVIVNGGNIYGAVFGGGANGHVEDDTHVTINDGVIGVNDESTGMSLFSVYRGNVYGGGRGIDTDPNGTTHEVSKTAGQVRRDTYVDVNGGTIHHNVYGGGSLANVGKAVYDDQGNFVQIVYGGETHVTISGGSIGLMDDPNVPNGPGYNNGHVFGAGRGKPGVDEFGNDYTQHTFVKNTHVTIEGGLIRGSVFGSGDNGHVYKDTEVNVTGGQIGEDAGPNQGNVFGGGRGLDTYRTEPKLSPTAAMVFGNTNVTVSGGTVKSNVYGGGNVATVGTFEFTLDGTGHVTGVTLADNTTGTTNVTVTGTATVGDGTAGYGHVFGACRGLLSEPLFSKVRNTNVTINSEAGSVVGNIYGGGELGEVWDSTNVVINSGTLHEVYGAGQGVANEANGRANIGDKTKVTVNNGIINNVYGGGQNGTVRYSGDMTNPPIATVVTVNNGTVKENVFGGGDQGTTEGRVIVNLNNGTIQGELFGGAKGTQGSVYVAGLKTVNMRGGTVYNHVYGGSRNANDGFALTDNTSSYTDGGKFNAFVNISGGMVRGSVYGAGFFGYMFGSSDINIGRDAILLANNKNIDRGTHTVNILRIIMNVFAGSNWGDYDPNVGFSSSTTTGRSNIYVDGNGYNTVTINGMEPGYMSIDGSLYGSGTSSDAGTMGRKIQVANYGEAVLGDQNMEPFGSRDIVPNVVLGASRYVQSIQRCDTVILDNSSIAFTGQGDISQNQNTVEYSLVYIQKGLYVRNGSNIVADMQIDETHAVYSQYRPDTHPTTGNPNGIYVKDPFTYWIGVGATDHNFYYNCESQTPTLLVDDPTDPTITNINTFRFNGGYSMYVRYKYKYEGGVISFADHGAFIFGELSGFFRMVTETGNETFAHARPKITSGTGNDNTADGGFLSYYNGGTNPANGHNTFTDNGAAYTCGQQFPYLNVLSSSGKGDRTDYRYWRIRESGSSNVVTTPVALFLYSHPNSTEQFHEIHATIELSTPDCSDSHYVLSDIDFGDNAHLVDAAIYDPDATGNTYYIVNSGSHDNHYHEVFLNQAGNSYSWPAAGIDTLAYEQSKITGHPNTHFGLVISPSGCLAGYNGNKSYIISENSKGYLVNNPDCKFDYPANPNGQLPGVSLRITYNKELTMSAALAPVVIQFKRYCGSSTTPEDIINIPVYITTQTELGQDINMTSYVMYGDLHTGNAKESYRVKATLPPFDPYEAGLTGEDIPFYIYNQSFTNSTVNASDPEPDFLPYTTTAFAANDHNMAFTYQIALNSDNKSGWRESIPNSVPHDFADGSTTPIQIGRADGRNPFSIDFTVYYNSCQEVITNEVSNMIYAKNDIIGTATFKVCYPITAAALHETPPSTVENDINWKTFEILVNIFKRDNSLGFYVDGIRGDNNYTGEYANFGLRTLQGVIDHNWKPGDKVYVVRPISVPSNTLIWTSETVGSTMTLYRYPGRDIDPDHHATTDDRSPYVHNNLNNPGENTGYYQQSATEVIEDGAIFANVSGTGDLTLSGVILDGMNGDQSLYPWCPSNFVLSDHQNQEVPFIKVSNGGKVTLTRGSEVRYSNIKSANPHGSAILVENGGTLELSNNVSITHNTFPSGSTGQGAGIYMEPGGTIIVGGSVNVTGNKNAAGRENNVYLSDMSCEITIDQDNELSKDARIGVTKYDFYPSDPNELIALGLDPELYDLSPIASSVFPERIKEAFRNDNFQDDTERAYTHYYIRNTLYFGKTWAHFVTNHNEYNATSNPEGIEEGSFTVDGEGNVTVTSSKAFAYLISYINGLNDVDEKHPNAKVRIASDVDVHEHYWKPIIGFNGTFDGQWYHIDGITVKREGFRSIGMFDNVIGGGVVKNTYISSSDIQPWNPEDTGDLEDIEQFAGCIAGTVDNGGLVTECQVAGTVIASAESANRFTYIGGAVGHIKSGGVVHSVIGMANLTGFTMGGIVGRVETGGSLYNSYSYTKTLTSLSLGNDYSGGLAGYVKTGGYVENCYADLQCAKPNYFGWFAGKNEGTIRYCYAPEGESTYVFNSVGATLTGHGNYGPVIDDIKALGYLYDDNKVTLAAGQTNDYHSNTITYANGRIDKWPGMVSALNHWIDANPHSIANLSRWYRPNTPYINRDLPVLGMVDHTNMSATSPDVNTLRYDPSIDGTLTYCNSDDTHDSYVFFYGKETDVTKTPDANVNVFINEDAVLVQKASGGKADPDPFRATVGITFDNSGTNAEDYFHIPLDYDWHLMSTPLSNASMGTTYDYGMLMGFGYGPNLTKMENGYFPNGLKVTASSNEDVMWDFYCYDEPDYHWINFKRSSYNHWHLDTINGVNNPPIHFDYLNNLGTYMNEETFTPGKGYMMAISQDSYMSNVGTLNGGNVEIGLTAMAPDGHYPGQAQLTYDKGSNLVGNPYQAYLDLTKVTAAHPASGTMEALTDFYIYDADLGVYAPYTEDASVNPRIPSQFIHQHQGFFVLTNADRTLTFTTAMTTDTPESTSYFRSEKVNYPVVNLVVYDTIGNRDLAIVELKRPELGGVKKVNNLRNADFKLYTHYEDEDYGLLFAPKEAIRIPLFFKTPHDGKYVLTWDTFNGTFSSLLLVDNLTGVYYDMLAYDHYEFDALATDYAARFYIVFSVTDVNEYNDDDINGNFAYFNGYGWVIEGQGQLELVDLLGHVLYADYLTGEQTIVHFDGIAAGMYMLRLVDGSKLKGVQKIVIR